MFERSFKKIVFNPEWGGGNRVGELLMWKKEKIVSLVSRNQAEPPEIPLDFTNKDLITVVSGPAVF
jgi:hypothetical protein